MKTYKISSNFKDRNFITAIIITIIISIGIVALIFSTMKNGEYFNLSAIVAITVLLISLISVILKKNKKASDDAKSIELILDNEYIEWKDKRSTAIRLRFNEISQIHEIVGRYLAVKSINSIIKIPISINDYEEVKEVLSKYTKIKRIQIASPIAIFTIFCFIILVFSQLINIILIMSSVIFVFTICKLYEIFSVPLNNKVRIPQILLILVMPLAVVVKILFLLK